MAISFSDMELVESIRRGEKDQTTRPWSQHRFNILLTNPHLSLWYKQRTPGRQKIGEADLESLFLIMFISPQGEGVELIKSDRLYPLLPERGITAIKTVVSGSPPQFLTLETNIGLIPALDVMDLFSLKPMTEQEVVELSRRDGFQTPEAFFGWLTNYYGHGAVMGRYWMVIRWKNLRTE